MPTFKIVLAYDGTDFVGWQRQASGFSIQGLLEDALGELDGRAVSVAGAGRTDAGVHALGQVASFSLDRAIGSDALVRAVNAKLPDAVRVVSAVEAAPTFHARFTARAKIYRYCIWNGSVVSPFEHRYAWHIDSRLDVAAMCAAARRIEGRHDFAAFQATGSKTATTERTILTSRISMTENTDDTDEESGAVTAPPRLRSPRGLRGGGLKQAGALITYDITGDGFLRHMVRIIVGTLVEIGRGRREVEWIDEVVASRSRAVAGPTAPAAGLVLVAVEYGAALAGEP